MGAPKLGGGGGGVPFLGPYDKGVLLFGGQDGGFRN